MTSPPLDDEHSDDPTAETCPSSDPWRTSPYTTEGWPNDDTEPEVNIIPIWTGMEARVLREALQMSMRHFAAHLGITDRAVSYWETGGSSITPRPLHQSALDDSLSTADAKTKNRFARLLRFDADDPDEQTE